MKNIYKWLESTTFFIASVGILIIQSIWLAISAIYPLPFDEYYHSGIIKIYSQQWSPFISMQPAEASVYGDITRMPSYLYHYLMSFPYRLFDVFIDSETVLVVLMRLINIAFVVAAIIVFRKLFMSVGVPRRLINVVALLFVFTPIVPFLAAHVNYDNLMLLGAAVSFFLAYQLMHEKRLSAKHWILFVSVGLLTILVKYTFFIISGILFTVVLFTFVRKSGPLKKSINYIYKDFSKYSLWMKLGLVMLLIAACSLFTERIGTNMIRYREPDPNCELVQTESVCSKFMPWYRNNQAKIRYEQTKEKEFGNIVSYSQHWVTKMMRGYYAIFSHTPTVVVSPLEPFGPIVLRPIMPIPITVAYIMVVIGGALIVVYRKILWRDTLIRVTIIVSGIYLGILWLFNYASYLKVGSAYAIQARYTYPLLLPIFLVFVTALKQVKVSRNTKMYVAVAVILLYSWGAGVSGWIIRSDSLWYWQNNTVLRLNQQAQNVLKIFIPH